MFLTRFVRRLRPLQLRKGRLNLHRFGERSGTAGLQQPTARYRKIEAFWCFAVCLSRSFGLRMLRENSTSEGSQFWEIRTHRLQSANFPHYDLSREASPTTSCGYRMFSCTTAWSGIKAVRRFTAIVVLLGYALGQGVVPLPRIVSKTSEIPFPCQHHACGCVSAAKCWKSCCCFTKEQKIAWAESRQIAVPYELMDDSESVAERADPPHLKSHSGKSVSGKLEQALSARGECCSSAGKHCCSTKSTGKSSSPSQLDTPDQRACCSGQRAQDQRPKSDQDEDQPEPISITDYLGCHGLQMFWVTTPPTLPPARLDQDLSLARSFDICNSGNDLLVSAIPSPPSPPPKIS